MLEEMKRQLSAEQAVTFTVRVRPHAKITTAKAIMSDGSIKIDLAAPAEDGKANAELLRFLGKEFGVSRQDVEILSGQTNRKKVMKITVA